MDVPTFVVTRWWAALITLALLGGVLVLAHLLIVSTQSAADPGSMTRRRRRGVKALVIGTDGRASTSKVQVLLWTLAVLYALTFLLLWGRSIGCDSKAATSTICERAADARAAFARLVEQPLDTEYYALLGLPTAAAVAAKALTQNKVVSGELTKPTLEETGEKGGVAKGLAEVVSDDGRTDLIDFQYFAFNLVALGYFAIEFTTTPSAGLPELPPTLIALSGVAVAAYTTKKALQKDVVPAITTVIPRTVRLASGTSVTVVGTGFGTPAGQGDERLLINGFPVPVDPTRWTERKIEAELPQEVVAALRDADPPTTAEVSLMTADGAVADPYVIELRASSRR